MSRGTIVVCALFAAACGIENELQYTATLEANTNGLALSEDGLDGTAGMVGMTCTVDTSFGCPTADIDLPTTEERVVDHFAGRTLGRSDVGLHVIEGGAWVQSLDLEASDVRAAGFGWEGPMFLTATGDSGCELHLPTGDAVAVSHQAACDRDARVSIDRDGALYVASQGSVFRIDDAGDQEVTEAGDLMAWDEVLGFLYTANEGEREVWALNREGIEQWRVKLRKPVLGLAARGTRGQLLVRLDHGDTTVIERLDGRDGTRLGRSEVGDEDGDMVVSENGRTLGFVQKGRVTFFRLATDPEDDEVVDETPADCMEAGGRVSAD